MTAEVVCDLLVVALIICSCVYAYKAGYQKRALEDKKLVENALVAQFRAEHAADVHHRCALVLLRAANQEKR